MSTVIVFVDRRRQVLNYFNREVLYYSNFILYNTLCPELKHLSKMLFFKVMNQSNNGRNVILLANILKKTRCYLMNIDNKHRQFYFNRIRQRVEKKPSLAESFGGILFAISGVAFAIISAPISTTALVGSIFISVVGFSMFYSNQTKRKIHDQRVENNAVRM